MKNWTVTFRSWVTTMNNRFEIWFNEYVTADCEADAVTKATERALTRKVQPIFKKIEECSVDPDTARDIDELLSDEYGYDLYAIGETLSKHNPCKIGLLHSTYDLYDSDDNTIACDLDIQIYLDPSTDEWEIWTAGETALVKTISAKDAPAIGFDEMYMEFGDDIRRWWVEHPEELKDWYDVTLPEGFEL